MKKDGYFRVPFRVLCGVCCADLGESDKPEGDLGYDGCEENNEIEDYLRR